jgi:hypothetical protein
MLLENKLHDNNAIGWELMPYVTFYMAQIFYHVDSTAGIIERSKSVHGI